MSEQMKERQAEEYRRLSWEFIRFRMSKKQHKKRKNK